MTDAWSLDVLTLFPQWFDWLLESRPSRNAIEQQQLALQVVDMRQWATNKHLQVDDTPYGGGAGMVLRVDVVVAALEGLYQQPLDTLRQERDIVLLTPAGRVFSDQVANEWALERRPTTVLCGRYEGFDWRVHEHVATHEISVGPYVLSGGEPAAMSIIDAVARKLPGALGNAESLVDETFSDRLDGAMEYPQYTRPVEFRGWTVPEILLGGHHANIDAWRIEQAQQRTQAARTSEMPDAEPSAGDS